MKCGFCNYCHVDDLTSEHAFVHRHEKYCPVCGKLVATLQAHAEKRHPDLCFWCYNPNNGKMHEICEKWFKIFKKVDVFD